MLRLAILTLLAVLLPAGSALADPGTTGGLPAGVPPIVSPQGGVNGPASSAPEVTASTASDPPADSAPADKPATPKAAPSPQARASQDSGDLDTADPSPSTESAASGSASSSSGGLPHTGFAIAALIAVGTGFFLTGYALRYSRALDG